MKLCIFEDSIGKLYARGNEQRLLRNMDVHVIILDLLRIPHHKVNIYKLKVTFNTFIYYQMEDTRMNHIMKLAHNLLQYFCYENSVNQNKLYDLYFNDYQQLSEVNKYEIFRKKF